MKKKTLFIFCLICTVVCLFSIAQAAPPCFSWSPYTGTADHLVIFSADITDEKVGEESIYIGNIPTTETTACGTEEIVVEKMFWLIAVDVIGVESGPSNAVRKGARIIPTLPEKPLTAQNFQ